MHGLEASTKTSFSLPVIDTGPYFTARSSGLDTTDQARILGAKIKHACHEAGMFYLIGHNIKHDLMDRVIAECASFFALPEEEKQKISCRRDPHFRGYGLLKNSRDWREQIHIGVEPGRREGADLSKLYWNLEGPNKWPTLRTNEFRETALAYINSIESLSRTVLTLLAEALELPSDNFTRRMKNNPYLLTKFMSYLPQSNSGSKDRNLKTETSTGEATKKTGVTAHCDWSWLTFLQQDNVGGLEAMDANGNWHKVTPLVNALVVNTGELLEIETGGYLRASPHRVINERIDRQRFSNAVFINPDLDAMIVPQSNQWGEEREAVASNDDDHIHKVIRPGSTLAPFVFGDSEWDRKGEGNWCYRKECLTPY
ncbi:isopenicillin N synthase family oxygenase [Candidatus Obscuribacterales bacterium]|nr:isopenicillin N synthase family oxygenase [Candidatus Obscuribacterales bacterium]